jgi:hypothetical protein
VRCVGRTANRGGYLKRLVLVTLDKLFYFIIPLDLATSYSHWTQTKPVTRVVVQKVVGVGETSIAMVS